jgi:phosphatidate cytidylyltransferase
MRARILTAVALAAVLIGVLLYGSPWAARALFGLFIAGGAWEWSAFLGASLRARRAAYMLVVASLAIAAELLLPGAREFSGLMLFGICWWTLALLWLLSAPHWTPGWAAALAGASALVPTYCALIRIINLWPHGAEWVLFILTLAFAADTGAFFVGRACGRVRLAPRVSPQKTWEGVLGGMGFAAIVGYAGSRWSGLATGTFVTLCLLGAAFSVVGDLTESMFKRGAGLKDSGRLFPGHGGILDRIDGVLAATPVMYIGLAWLGVAT